VDRRSPPAGARGSNDISVIVDGERDGRITATGSNLQDNSQVECTACYISRSTDVNMWIRIYLSNNYFVTEINIFTGGLLENYYILFYVM